ncbi:hypothetical protein G5B40_12920 [Pikeienuella piscinae]|uniref:LPS-assembly lipoprotein n=1 Tax=Pikeienuella piscinae TaxID=2748098 RepID=A0A7L5C282_9RHOB|nr:LPS assembly lipoprotein LptE [Pikeienuella piscinae]QIE56284.1 hypothetical protein G5B40_12920 [Pikeienuella piscinae]
MSCFERRGVLLLMAGALAGCGFRPLYGGNSGAQVLLGGVILQEATAPEDFAYRERLRRRLGLEGANAGANDAGWRLTWVLRFEDSDIAVTPGADTTRYRLIASATYRLESTDDATASVKGEVSAIGAYDATASTFATRAAARAERRDLSVELAELTATQLLADAARRNE